MPIEFNPPQANLNYQITPVQYTDPLATLSQMGQLRTQNLQRQGAEQELQAGGLRLQQAKEDLADQQKLREVYGQWMQSGNKNFDDLLTQAGSAGVGPRTLLPLQQQIVQQRKERAAADEADFKNLVSRQAQITQSLNAVASAPPDQRPAAWQTERARLLTGGFAKPEEIEPYYPGDVVFEEKRHHSRTSEQELALTKEEREAAAAKLTATKTEQEIAGTERKQYLDDLDAAPRDPATGTPTPAAAVELARKYPKLVPPQITRQYMRSVLPSLGPVKSETELAQVAADVNRPQEERDEAIKALDTLKKQKEIANTEAELARVATDPSQPAEKRAAANAALNRLDQSKLASRPVITIPGVPTGPLTGAAAELHGEDFLKTLPPAFAARIKNIASGNEAAPTGRTASTGAGLQLMTSLYQYDPEFTPLLAQKRRETLHEFTKTGAGSAGGNIVALNTMIHHADLYLETADALKNGTFRPGNEIYNKVATAFGKAPPTNAGLVAQFFAGETAKVAGEQTQGAVNELLEKMKTSNSPEQIRGAGETLLGIAAGRMVPYKERIADAKLEGLAPPVLGPSAREILQRRGFDPETMKPAASSTGGKTYKYNYSKSGHQIGSDDGKTWYDRSTGQKIQ